MPAEEIDYQIDPDDEFGVDYDEPSSLRPEDVAGTVVYTLDWTVKTVVDQIDADPEDPDVTGSIITTAPFQRRTAWDKERQSRFIESLMLGLPIPPLVLAESLNTEGQFYVLDGKQRLTSLKQFVGPTTQLLRLRDLELLDDELNGLTYDKIRASATLRKYAMSMLSQPVRTIVVRNWRTPALLHLIFARLNKATVPLASHELRQAIFPGPLTNYVNQRSGSSAELLRARRLSEPDFRLRDAETLLRFISFKTNLQTYSGDLRDFLDRCLKGGNDHFTDIEGPLEELVLEMERAISAVFSLFDSRAFLRFDGERNKYMPRFNVAVFDAMTWYLTDTGVRDAALDAGPRVMAAFEKLCLEDSEFAASLTSTTKSPEAVNRRLARWGHALSAVIGRSLEPEEFTEAFLPIAPRVRR
jgi:hypothetical protein